MPNAAAIGSPRAIINLRKSPFANGQVRYPVLIHCVSGRDRAGVVVAALLKILCVLRVA